jgi:cell division protease FtsH
MPVLPVGREPGGDGGTGPASGGMTGPGTGPQRQPVPAGPSSSQIPAYGTPPPPGWSAPGWPPRGGALTGGTPAGGGSANGSRNVPSGAETTRLPAAPAPAPESAPAPSPAPAPESGPESGPDSERGGSSDEETGTGSSADTPESTRAWSAVDGDGRRGGSRRREDKDPDWRAPWERDD